MLKESFKSAKSITIRYDNNIYIIHHKQIPFLFHKLNNQNKNFDLCRCPDCKSNTESNSIREGNHIIFYGDKVDGAIIDVHGIYVGYDFYFSKNNVQITTELKDVRSKSMGWESQYWTFDPQVELSYQHKGYFFAILCKKTLKLVRKPYIHGNIEKLLQIYPKEFIGKYIANIENKKENRIEAVRANMQQLFEVRQDGRRMAAFEPLPDIPIPEPNIRNF